MDGCERWKVGMILVCAGVRFRSVSDGSYLLKLLQRRKVEEA